SSSAQSERRSYLGAPLRSRKRCLQRQSAAQQGSRTVVASRVSLDAPSLVQSAFDAVLGAPRQRALLMDEGTRQAAQRNVSAIEELCGSLILLLAWNSAKRPRRSPRSTRERFWRCSCGAGRRSRGKSSVSLGRASIGLAPEKRFATRTARRLPNSC